MNRSTQWIPLTCPICKRPVIKPGVYSCECFSKISEISKFLIDERRENETINTRRNTPAR